MKCGHWRSMDECVYPRCIGKLPERTEEVPGCHAGQDGECTWEHCPQLHDNEPEHSGRNCPLVHWTEGGEY